MAKSDEAEKRHTGLVAAMSDDGIRIKETDPHYKHECEEKCDAARAEIEAHIAASKAQAGETVYEAPESRGHASVGYSRAYADNFDAVFGKN